MAYNCLDVHVQNGRGDQDALIYDSPVTGTKERFTYQELLQQVSTLAGAMKDCGVEPSDRVDKPRLGRDPKMLHRVSRHTSKLTLLRISRDKNKQCFTCP